MDSWSEFLQMLLQQSVQKIQQQLGQIQKLGRVCVTAVWTNPIQQWLGWVYLKKTKIDDNILVLMFGIDSSWNDFVYPAHTEG